MFPTLGLHELQFARIARQQCYEGELENTFDWPSLAEIPEPDLVRCLLADPYWRSFISGLYGMPASPLLLREVSLAGAPGNVAGEVDILLCSADRPDFATAIEVKRVKLGAEAIRSGRPNKLQEVKKGIQQANKLAAVGFAQVYLYVLVVADTREQNFGKKSYEGPSIKLRSIVDGAISVLGLEPRVGLCKWDFVQPMDYEPLGLGTSGGHLIRLAQAVKQTPELTQWIARTVSGGQPCRS